MTRASKLYAQIRLGSRPSFRELCKVAEAFGFELKRIDGSHHIYRHPTIPSNLNLQPEGKDAKGYQVKQFLAMVEQFSLKMADE